MIVTRCAQLLDFGEDVARQQDGATFSRCFQHALLEHRLHQRVEAGCRLVEQQQFGTG